MKKLFSVRGILTLFLVLSTIFASLATYNKIAYWGFSFNPKEKTDVWTIDAHISFAPNEGENIMVELSIPHLSEGYKILSEDVVAKGYKVEKDESLSRIKMTSAPRKKHQDLYYRIMLYDNEEISGKVRETAPKKTKMVNFVNEQQADMAAEIWELAEETYKEEKNLPAKIILLLNEKPLNPQVDAFLPVKKNQRIMADLIVNMLAYKNIPAHIIRGVRLNERKKSTPADLMIEAYESGKWMVYDINTAKTGFPKNFIAFQRGNVSLLDVAGGSGSKINFSVIKSPFSTFKMAGRRAKYENSKYFDFSIYNLPTLEQNTLKWLMIFPLGILLVVLLRNVVGIQTMGTFTPMLIALSLIKTGFFSGLLCYTLIIGLGLAIRAATTRLNLLLVPRISAVVIFVILIMQALTIVGYNYDIQIAASAVFFPIIITAWIIERASITWEEEGVRNAVKQIFNTMAVGFITYIVLSNKYILHIMYAFNEWNLVILFIVMLLGTYTGYRLTELKRLSPLVDVEQAKESDKKSSKATAPKTARKTKNGSKK